MFFPLYSFNFWMRFSCLWIIDILQAQNVFHSYFVQILYFVKLELLKNWGNINCIKHLCICKNRQTCPRYWFNDIHGIEKLFSRMKFYRKWKKKFCCFCSRRLIFSCYKYPLSKRITILSPKQDIYIPSSRHNCLIIVSLLNYRVCWPIRKTIVVSILKTIFLLLRKSSPFVSNTFWSNDKIKLFFKISCF